MDNDCDIHRQLCAKIHPEAVVNGIIDRKLIAGIVFSDNAGLACLNEIVHGAVVADLHNWCRQQSMAGRNIQFVETAILIQSGLRWQADCIWQVTAPVDLRIARVQKRSGLTVEEVKARIESQQSENLGDIPHNEIQNDISSALLPQLHCLLSDIEDSKNAV